ncbi:MAG: helix-turn-helix transcriptional regulator [Pirellulaceae bacterium]
MNSFKEDVKMEVVHLRVGITLDAEAIATLIALLRKVIPEAPVEDAKREARLHASRNALFAGQKPPEDRGLLIDNREAAKLLKISARTLWAMWHRGEMPPPIRIGKAIRWSYEELSRWVAAGCPPQEGHKPDRK